MRLRVKVSPIAIFKSSLDDKLANFKGFRTFLLKGYFPV